MDNIDFVDEISRNENNQKYLEGLPRECKKCKTWARYKKPKKHNGCFTVRCPSCNDSFEVVVGMKNSRK